MTFVPPIMMAMMYPPAAPKGASFQEYEKDD